MHEIKKILVCRGGIACRRRPLGSATKIFFSFKHNSVFRKLPTLAILPYLFQFSRLCLVCVILEYCIIYENLDYEEKKEFYCTLSFMAHSHCTGRDRERWISTLCYVLYTLHRDSQWNWEWERGPLASIAIFPFLVPSPVPFPIRAVWISH